MFLIAGCKLFKQIKKLLKSRYSGQKTILPLRNYEDYEETKSYSTKFYKGIYSKIN